MLSDSDVTAFFITIKLASITTLILVIIGIPLALWLNDSKWRFKFIIEALIAMPLVLPPTVLGFYLLIALGPNGPLGAIASFFGASTLSFSFQGLVIGSVIYSMPFVVQPLQNTFQAIGKRPLELAASLGASPLDRFFNVLLPLARSGLVTAVVLGFAHTIGEFGVVLMIGGNIPGATQVLSIAIYEHVESLDYARAHFLSAILLGISFVLLLIIYGFNHRFHLGVSK